MFLWLAVRGSDLASIRAALASARWVWAVPFLAVLFAFYWLKSIRWRVILSTERTIRASQLFPIVMIGYAGTAVLPMQLGELIRAYIAGKKYALPYSLTISSIAIERLFDLLTILALLGSILLFGESTPEVLVKAGYVVALIVTVGFGMATWIVINTQQVVTITSWILGWAPVAVSDGACELIRTIDRGLVPLKRPRLLLNIGINSVIQWMLMGVCIWISLKALDIQVPVSAVALVLVATIVGISMPTSPGYIGNIQFAFVVALQPYGIDSAAAIAASIFYHVIAYVAVVAIGFGFLHRMGYQIREIEDAVQTDTG